MIAYVDLPAEAKEVIHVTKERFADCFDSEDFGPFITEFHRFDNDRLAVLLDLAIGQLFLYVNIPGFILDVKQYPYGNPAFRQAAILALTIEIILHLIRSYTEIPDTTAVQAPDVRRRDYHSRWQTTLKDYQDQLKQLGKRLTAEAYQAQYAAGMYTKTLIDFPSATVCGWPAGYAEKGGYWGWF